MSEHMVFIGQSTCYKYETKEQACIAYDKLRCRNVDAALVNGGQHGYTVTVNYKVIQIPDFHCVSRFMSGLFATD